MDKTDKSTLRYRHKAGTVWAAGAGGFALFAMSVFFDHASVSAAPIRPAPVIRALTEKPIYIAVGDYARPPMGWVQFCSEHAEDCRGGPTAPRDVRLTAPSWTHLVEINDYVNETIKPATDLDVYGKVEYWTYPGERGDCEDYVLLKRKLLLDAGWPREALLITVVRDQRDEGHAVLTVRTDHGEFILDNQVADILPWHETGYRFVKRQSQSDPNRWVALGDNRPQTPVTSSDHRP
ncbi:transglutaminase [Blastochloris tepida]|uniref:Transglutaminase n=2 Tax=Blastochloris tepida TaxID=2233851 RepID=A0A348G0Q3_9HYPH|nr:transglutaminase-like cysteine peptidase [Blastochloris tepida]BBF93136.1 transglutaminase [Blastochloris tepida]